jgi:predicted ArsR family transcriptional regulator
MVTRLNQVGPKRPVGETRALVAQKLAQGMSKRDIAIALGISTQAVYQHIAALEKQEASA